MSRALYYCTQRVSVGDRVNILKMASLYDAIVSYNTAAEDFAKKYVSLAMVFQSYSVSFSPSDGGSIFVFPAGGGGL